MKDTLDFHWTCPTTDDVQLQCKGWIKDDDLTTEEKVDEVDREIERLRSLFVQMRAQADDQINEAVSSYLSADSEKDTLQDDVDTLTNELNEALARIEELEAENESLREQLGE